MVVKIDFSVFYVLICFIIIFWVARKSIFKPLNTILDGRRERIESSHRLVEANTAEIEEALSTYNKQLMNAKSEGFSTRQDMKNEGIDKQKELIDKARGEAAEKIAHAQEDLEGVLTEAKARMERESAQLAEAITAAVLGRGR